MFKSSLRKSRKEREAGCQSTDWVARRRRGFHKLLEHGSIFRLRLLQNAVHVILHGLQGEIQTSSDFLVGKPLCKERSKLMFARGQFTGGLRASRLHAVAFGNVVK